MDKKFRKCLEPRKRGLRKKFDFQLHPKKLWSPKNWASKYESFRFFRSSENVEK